MNPRLHPWLVLCLLAGLNACEKRDHDRHSGDSPVGIGKIRTKTAPRTESPAQDHRLSAREELVKAEAVTDAPARAKAMAEVAWNAIETDPELAREILDRLPPGSPEKIALIQHLAMRMADENPDAALEWAAALTSETEIAAARARIALVIADSDPVRAANLLSEFGVANREFEVAVVQVLQHWAARDPAEAAAWVAMFPAGGFRKAGIGTVVARWTATQPQAVVAWLPSIQDESARAEATQAVGEILRQQDPATREAWLRDADPAIRAALESPPGAAQ